MVIIITGASHTGKTLLSQRLLENLKFPYLSIDHLKMGLIRSKNTDLTPYDDDKLVPYLWGIVKEIIKTAIENRQNLIVEGAYVPDNWEDGFSEEYLKNIRCFCLVMSEEYIDGHFEDITGHSCEIERRIDDSDCTKEFLKAENKRYMDFCAFCGCRYYEIKEKYDIDGILRSVLSSWDK